MAHGSSRGPTPISAPGTTFPGVVGEPIFQPADPDPAHGTPARALAQITSGEAGYHLGLSMLCPTEWIRQRWPTTGAAP